MPHSLVQKIGELGPAKSFRTVLSDERRVVVEINDDRSSRFIQIDIEKRTLAQLKSLSDVTLGANSRKRTRWNRVNSTRAGGAQHAFTITWGDNLDPKGKAYQATIRGERHYLTLCPEDIDLVFVGTRRSASEGDGRVYCFSRGKLLWTYSPPQREVHYVMTTRKYESLKAFPFIMSSPIDASLLAFSFLHYLYVLDAGGNLLSLHTTPEILGELAASGDEETVGRTTETIETEEMSLELTCEVNPGFPPPRYPLVRNILFSEDGSVCIATTKNVIVWLTRTGRVAHVHKLNIGNFHGIGDVGSITSMRASINGDILLAGVACGGFSILQGGKLVGVHKFDEWRGLGMDLDEYRKLVACYYDGEVILFDVNAVRIGAIGVSTPVRELEFAGKGRVLLIHGDMNPVLAIDRED